MITTSQGAGTLSKEKGSRCFNIKPVVWYINKSLSSDVATRYKTRTSVSWRQGKMQGRSNKTGGRDFKQGRGIGPEERDKSRDNATRQ